jgi:hypothetical protein
LVHDLVGPLIDALFSVWFGDAVSLLDLADQLISFAFNLVEIVVG